MAGQPGSLKAGYDLLHDLSALLQPRDIEARRRPAAVLQLAQQRQERIEVPERL